MSKRAGLHSLNVTLSEGVRHLEISRTPGRMSPKSSSNSALCHITTSTKLKPAAPLSSEDRKHEFIARQVDLALCIEHRLRGLSQIRPLFQGIPELSQILRFLH
jgi:hypothetical protein